MDRVILEANEGMVLTDGTIYGVRVILPQGNDGSGFYEITEAKYEELTSEENQISDSEALNILLGGEANDKS